jgi:hypothetical protein
MTTTIVKNGQLITSTATEQDLEPEGPFEDGGVVLVQAETKSGTVYFGVGPAGGSPVINGSTPYGSYTTDGKALRTIDPGAFNFRCVGVGTFIISW